MKEDLTNETQWDFHYYDKVGLSAHGNVACHWKAYNF
jgi:hypothetical protein